MQCLTPIGEFAYPSVFRPAAPMEGGNQANREPQYQLTVFWDEDDPKLKSLQKKIEEVAVAKFGAKAVQMLARGQLKSPLRHGDERPDTEWLEGKKFMTARSTDRPDVVDQDLEDIIDSKEIYPGAIGRMDVWLYAFDKAGNKGVAAILNNVQKTDDGDRKGGRRSAGEAFGGSDDEDEKPSSRRRRNEDDDETPRRRRSRDDDEGDATPRRRRR